MKLKIPVVDPLDRNFDSLIYLGIDAEIFPLTKPFPARLAEVIYPHQLGVGSQRSEVPGLWRLPHHGDWHGDGFALELCTEPTTCVESLLQHVASLLELLGSNIPGGGRFIAPAILKIPGPVLHDAPPKVKQLGCAPSLNVYNDPGEPARLVELRTTGCHIHLSTERFDRNPVEVLANVIRWADVLAGTAWTFVSPEPPAAEALRRKSYGRAGEYRVRSYPPGDSVPFPTSGVEYRVLPGRVISHPVYLSLMVGLVRAGFILAHQGYEPPAQIIEQARTAINHARKDVAEDVLLSVPMTVWTRRCLNFLSLHPLPYLSTYRWTHYAIERVGWRRYVSQPLRHLSEDFVHQ